MALAGAVHADSVADGVAAGSPGLLSGNGIQLPVELPVSACGNTVNVVGLLNPAMGNTCTHRSGDTATEDRPQTPDAGRTTAEGTVEDSPGVISGNGVRLPIDLPVNVSGNTVNVAGVANPAFGNQSTNTPEGPTPEPTPPSQPQPPVHVPPTHTPTPHTEPPAVPRPPLPPTTPTVPKPAPAGVPQRGEGPALAHTGTGAAAAAAASLSALLAGSVLYRRFGSPKPGRQR